MQNLWGLVVREALPPGTAEPTRNNHRSASNFGTVCKNTKKHESANRMQSGIQSNRRARWRACRWHGRWASAVTRRPAPKFCAADAGRSAQSLRGLTYHSADTAVNQSLLNLFRCASAEQGRRRHTLTCYAAGVGVIIV
jgi:hypothetical protein